MENRVNWLKEEIVCHCGACEQERTMNKSTIKKVAVILVLVLAVAWAYKNRVWIQSKLMPASV